MTVAELIEELKDYPPDMRVVTRGGKLETINGLRAMHEHPPAQSSSAHTQPGNDLARSSDDASLKSVGDGGRELALKLARENLAEVAAANHEAIVALSNNRLRLKALEEQLRRLEEGK